MVLKIREKYRLKYNESMYGNFRRIHIIFNDHNMTTGSKNMAFLAI